MSRTTVVRQNNCILQMRWMLCICFSLYMALQVFAAGDASVWSTRLNLALYLVFVPGFLFAEGYRFAALCRMSAEEARERKTLLWAVRYLITWLLLSLAFMIVVQSRSLKECLAQLLSLLELPAAPAVFLTLALVMLVIHFFGYRIFSVTVRCDRRTFAVMGLLLLTALLWSSKDSYVLTAVCFGSSAQPAVPGVPYFVYFMLGILFWEKKPGFQWKTAAFALAVSAVSLALYVTPLRPLARVALSALPVYLFYCAAELLFDASLRLGALQFACESSGLVFWIQMLLLFFLSGKNGFENMDPKKALSGGAAVLLLIYVGIALFFGFSWVYTRLANRFEQRVRHRTAWYFLIYTVSFAILAALAFSYFIVTGRTLISKGDATAQYFPRLIYFWRYMRNLISQLLQGNFEIQMYDFRNGLGGEVSFSFEPLYFLYLLFDEEHLELAYSLMTVLRFYLSGVAFSVLCLYFKKSYFSTFIAAVLYVFCGFSLYGGILHPMFMIPMITLPVLILSIEEILKKRRWYLCSVFVALSLFGNYYYLYMNTIAMGIYFLVRFFCQKDRSLVTLKNFIGRGLVICGSYLLGVGMSCIVLVTKFGAYLGSGRSGSSAAVIKTPSLFYYAKDWLVRCFMNFITSANAPGEWLKFGFLPVALLAAVFLFLRKGRKELKTFFILALIFAAFPVFGFIFSGFSSVLNRWCYMAALVVAYLVADTLPDMQRLSIAEKRILAVVTAIYGYLAWFGEVRSNRYSQMAALLLALTLVVVLACQEEVAVLHLHAKKSLALALTFALVFYQGYSLYDVHGTGAGYMKQGRVLDEITTTPLSATTELEDDSFYRVAVPKLDYYTINSSGILDYNSVSQFNSTPNANVLNFMRKMGLTSFSAVILRGLGNRTFLDNLASVKYFAEYDDETSKPLQYGCEELYHSEVDGRAVTVYENAYALPLGYTYSTAITEEELESYDVAERQEVLMQAAAVDADSEVLTFLDGSSGSAAGTASGDAEAEEQAEQESASGGSGNVADSEDTASASGGAESADAAETAEQESASGGSGNAADSEDTASASGGAESADAAETAGQESASGGSGNAADSEDTASASGGAENADAAETAGQESASGGSGNAADSEDTASASGGAESADAAKEAGQESTSDGIQITGHEIAITSVEESRAYLTEQAIYAGRDEEAAAARASESKEAEDNGSGAGTENTENSGSESQEADGSGQEKVFYDVDDTTYDLTLYFNGEANAETYLILENALLEGDMSEETVNLKFTMANGESFTYPFKPDDSRYKSGQSDYVFNLGYHEEPITSCTIRIDREAKIDFEAIKIYSQPMDALPDYTEALRENVLENVSVETNRVSGTISLEENRLLVLTIPYQNGWTAYVDGVKTELERANYMFLALPLTAGDHTIELEYAIPGLSYAMAIMPSSLALLLILIFAGNIRRRVRRRRPDGNTGGPKPGKRDWSWRKQADRRTQRRRRARR